MENLTQFVLLVAGFVMLIKGADIFVEGAAGIARKFRIPQLIIGLTIVAMGTSAPEAAVSIAAALKGNGDIALGNVLGSNIMNIMIILGISAIIVPIAVGQSTIKIEMPFMILITLVLMVLGMRGWEVARPDGFILWAFFLLYLGYLFNSAKVSMKVEAHKKDEKEEKERSALILLIMTVAGGALIVFGSDVTVNAATNIATWLGVSSRVIALTVVAFGTSLPEFVTSLTAARRGNADIAIGNVVGSNVFNILFVIGTTALISDVTFAHRFIVDMIVAIAAAILVWIFAAKDKKLTRTFGVIMVVLYGVYLAYLIMG